MRRKFFVKLINFFRPKFEKWQNIVFVSTKCWDNFSSMHLGWFYSKTFHVLDFLSSWELIWLISFWVICLWNKFTGKAPCEFVLNEEEDYSLSLIYSMSGKIPFDMHLEYIKTIWLIYVTLSTVITFEFTLVRTNLLILTF